MAQVFGGQNSHKTVKRQLKEEAREMRKYRSLWRVSSHNHYI
jgi:hypothetical protein